jgi:hypothetical protein
MNHYYIIRVEDTERTFNLNMHSYHCFALSEAEAIGKMFINRPEFAHRKIEDINLIY